MSVAELEIGLSFSSTVSRHVVHRAAICEVFLTDSAKLGEDHFVLAAQLPRVHSYYSDHTLAPAAYDPLLLTEVVRQASILIAHQHMGAPLDHKFIYNMSDLKICDAAALTIRDRPGHMVLDARLTSTKTRGDAVVGMGLDMTLRVDGESVGTMEIVIQWMPPTAWDALRARGRAALDLSEDRAHSISTRLPSYQVGRLLDPNVVLGGFVTGDTSLTANVVVDQTHPGLFDHPLDHVPGMLLFEAMRQAGVLAAHELLGLASSRLYLAGCRAEFTRFGEFELPTSVEAVLLPGDRQGRVRFAVDVRQDDVTIARGEIELATTARRAR